MSGHITSTSRGSSVGSSASSPSSTSRSTSTWRAGAVAGVHLDRPVVVGRAAAPRRRATALARRSSWSQPSRRVGRAARRSTAARRGAAAVGEGALQLADVAAEGGQQRVADALVAVVVGARHRTARRPRRPAPATARSEGCGSHRCTSRCSPSAPSSSTSVTGSRVWPKSESRVGQVERLGRRRAAGPASSRVPHVRAAARRRPPPAGATARAARRGRASSARPAAVGVAARATSPRPAAAAARRTPRTAAPAAGRPRSAGPGAGRPPRRSRPWPTWRARVRAHGSSRDASSTVEQRPDQRVGRPRVLVAGAGDLGDQRARGCGSRRRRRRRRRAAARRPSRCESRWREPALHALAPGPPPPRSANGSASGLREQVAEGVGEQVGARRAVEVERHGRHPMRGRRRHLGVGGHPSAWGRMTP